MPYDVVVATRNRLDALRISLPLIVAQSAPARRIFVIDASDDHAAVAAYCAGLAAQGAAIAAIPARARNLPAQRNQGLAAVEAEIVAFPDDDSHWFPDTAERLLEAYAADAPGAVGGIDALEVGENPAGDAESAPRKSATQRLKRMVTPWRRLIENRLAPPPFEVFAHERIAALGGGGAVVAAGLRLVETLGGFRMSFRTRAIRSVGFNETLGYAVGYATHEDKDASLRLLNAGWLLAGAPRARVFHNVHPGRRAGGFAYGFCHLFNYAYICHREMDGSAAARAAILPYLRHKVRLYGLRRADAYGRDVWRGGRAALQEAAALLAGTRERADDAYREGCDRRLR